MCACSRNKRRTTLLAEARPRGIQRPAAGAADSTIVPRWRHPIAITTAIGTMVSAMVATVVMTSMMASSVVITSMVTTSVMAAQ